MQISNFAINSKEVSRDGSLEVIEVEDDLIRIIKERKRDFEIEFSLTAN